jgi:hypothetical protein
MILRRNTIVTSSKYTIKKWLSTLCSRRRDQGNAIALQLIYQPRTCCRSGFEGVELCTENKTRSVPYTDLTTRELLRRTNHIMKPATTPISFQHLNSRNLNASVEHDSAALAHGDKCVESRFAVGVNPLSVGAQRDELQITLEAGNLGKWIFFQYRSRGPGHEG